MILLERRMMIDGSSYTCGVHSMTYGEAEFLCCTPETGVALCVNSMQIKKKKNNICRNVQSGVITGCL